MNAGPGQTLFPRSRAAPLRAHSRDVGNLSPLPAEAGVPPGTPASAGRGYSRDYQHLANAPGGIRPDIARLPTVDNRAILARIRARTCSTSKARILRHRIDE